MGSCRSEYLRDQSLVNRQIEKEQQLAKRENRRIIKLLFLGPGESGKSTVLKQLRLMQLNGFTQNELLEYRSIIYSNILICAAALIDATQTFEIPFDDPYLQEHTRIILDVVGTENERQPLKPEVYNYIKHLWADAGIQRCYRERNKFQLNDSAKYFLDKLDEIYKSTYMPTEDDAIRVRATTVGVAEIQFSYRNLVFRVIDVGGQRSERRKWIHQFDRVNSVIFVAAISEYDLMMREDSTTNRMHDARALFESVINSVWFHKTEVILFLNKRDQFAQKIQSNVPITLAFPDYKGVHEYDACAKYIADQFVSANQNEKRKIAVHQTCATDGNQCKKVINNVMVAVMDANMKGGTV